MDISVNTSGALSPGSYFSRSWILLFLFFLVTARANAQQLAEFLSLAEANNPQLQAYEIRYSVAVEKKQEAATLPDTELGAGWFASEPETRTGAQKARFSIRQMLPWFGTITAREDYAASLAEASYESLAMYRRELTLEVAETYYSLLGNRALQQVLEDNIQLLEIYEEQAVTGVEVDRASLVDVLRIQIRKADMEERSAIVGQRFRAISSRMNALLNRETDISITLRDSLWMPLEDPPVDASAIQLHPELLRYDRLYESVAREESLNQKEAAPNLGFGLDYIPVQERADMAFDDNGKDILMPMVSVTVPVFNHRYRSQTRQNALRQQELSAQRAERKNRLLALLDEAIIARNNARIQYETQIASLRKARNAEEILIKNYETGTLDFDELLEVQDLQLKIQMKAIEAMEAYWNQAARINYISGN